MAMVKRSVPKSLSLKSQSAFFHTEKLRETQRLGYRWVEVPVAYFPRRGANFPQTDIRQLLWKAWRWYPLYQDWR
jgi:hypothetical protein